MEFLLFLLIFARAVAPGVNKDQILFYAFPAPECHRAEVGNAFQLPLLYSFLPLHFFYFLPGISGRGNGLLTAPGFSRGVGDVFQALVWVPGEGTALQELLGEEQPNWAPQKTPTVSPSILLHINPDRIHPCVS